MDKYLSELSSQLSAKGVQIEYTSEARSWLADRGYDPAMGARPMIRLIQEKIKRPLSTEILYGKLEHGGLVSVGVENGELRFSYTQAEPKSDEKEKVDS